MISITKMAKSMMKLYSQRTIARMARKKMVGTRKEDGMEESKRKSIEVSEKSRINLETRDMTTKTQNMIGQATSTMKNMDKNHTNLEMRMKSIMEATERASSSMEPRGMVPMAIPIMTRTIVINTKILSLSLKSSLWQSMKIHSL